MCVFVCARVSVCVVKKGIHPEVYGNFQNKCTFTFVLKVTSEEYNFTTKNNSRATLKIMRHEKTARRQTIIFGQTLVQSFVHM